MDNDNDNDSDNDSNNVNCIENQSIINQSMLIQEFDHCDCYFSNKVIRLLLSIVVNPNRIVMALSKLHQLEIIKKQIDSLLCQ